MKRIGKGFTLIELLVVIAIIAILAAILFPIFISAKDKGRQATCLNNQRQLGSAMVQYLSDWTDTFPTIVATTAYGTNWRPPANPYGVFYPLSRYIKSSGILKCPSAQPAKVVYGDSTYDGPISYLLNGYPSSDAPALCGTIWPPNQFRKPAKLSEVASTTRVIIIQDHRVSTYCGDIINGFHPWYVLPGIHLGGMTFSFADGHAEWVKTTGVEFFEKMQNWTLDYPSKKISWRRNYQ